MSSAVKRCHSPLKDAIRVFQRGDILLPSIAQNLIKHGISVVNQYGPTGATITWREGSSLEVIFSPEQMLRPSCQHELEASRMDLLLTTEERGG